MSATPSDRGASGAQRAGADGGVQDGAGAERDCAGLKPRHVAIVMDGNGRWARAHGAVRADGHRAGVGAVRMVIEECVRHGIGALTLFAFSSENWGRPRDEVMGLMSLFVESLEAEISQLHSRGVRLRFIGERAELDARLRASMASSEQTTAANERLSLQVALSYGGRSDILAAARRLALQIERRQLCADQIDEPTFAAALALGGLPDPDLFIRTGGEQRISNFLLWNLAYTELYFTDRLWPDFDAAAFDEALRHFAVRQRRFGLTGEQIQAARGPGGAAGPSAAEPGATQAGATQSGAAQPRAHAHPGAEH